MKKEYERQMKEECQRSKGVGKKSEKREKPETVQKLSSILIASPQEHPVLYKMLSLSLCMCLPVYVIDYLYVINSRF